jgi:hypothetical protein
VEARAHQAQVVKMVLAELTEAVELMEAVAQVVKMVLVVLTEQAA